MDKEAQNEMEQIHKGLEDFLERELQIYTLEDENKREKELNIIGEAEYRQNLLRATRDKAGNYNSGNAEQVRSENYRSGNAERVRSENYRSGNAEQVRSENYRSGNAERVRSENYNPENAERVKLKNYNSENTERTRSDGSRSGDAKRNGKQASKSTGARKAKASDAGSGRSRKKKGRKGSGIRKFLITVVLLLAVGLLGLYLAVGSVYKKLNYSEIESVSAKPMQENGVVNILLIGNDSRENGEDGRSDAMILLSVSKKTKTIYLTSLLRDMYVDIPGHDGNRLNAAYSYGGPELLMKTVEQNFDIPVNRYVLVNFEAFANLVDAVEGVDLELTGEEIEYVNGYLVEYNILTNRPQGTDNMDPAQAGLVHLNGPQALAYCRNRYIGTDFGRTERQRKVLSEVFRKMPRTMVTNPGEVIDGLMPNLTTNLTQNECYLLSLSAGKILTYDIVSDNIPQPDTYSNATIRKMSVLQVDFEANKKYLREKLYGEDQKE